MKGAIPNMDDHATVTLPSQARHFVYEIGPSMNLRQVGIPGWPHIGQSYISNHLRVLVTHCESRYRKMSVFVTKGMRN